MTKVEVQSIIDKGGYLARPEHIFGFRLIKPLEIESDVFFWGKEIYPYLIERMPIPFGATFREATPEEVKKHLHI